MHRRTSDRHGSSTASALRRAAALVLALAFLLAQVASQVHRAEKAHRLCAEHGTLEHGHDLDGLSTHEHEHDHELAAVLAEPIDGPSVPESHAACELAQLLHVPQAGAPAVALAVSTVAPAATAAAPREEVRPREVRRRRESARGPPRAA